MSRRKRPQTEVRGIDMFPPESRPAGGGTGGGGPPRGGGAAPPAGAMSSEPPPLPYAAAGVDLDARRRFIDRIRPIARSTHGPEVLAGVGPFGGVVPLRGP